MDYHRFTSLWQDMASTEAAAGSQLGAILNQHFGASVTVTTLGVSWCYMVLLPRYIQE